MRGWVGSLHRAAPAFAERVLGLSPDHPAEDALHEAARLVATASTLTDMRAATDALARGMEAIGLDHWRDYLSRAAERAQGLELRIGRPLVTRDVALRIDGLLMGAMGYLDGVAHYMEGNLPPEEYKDLVKLIAAAMAETIELSSRLHVTFPDIIPKELRLDKRD
jgi:hypothetical protein